jgi:hypothetical protein
MASMKNLSLLNFEHLWCYEGLFGMTFWMALGQQWVGFSIS